MFRLFQAKGRRRNFLVPVFLGLLIVGGLVGMSRPAMASCCGESGYLAQINANEKMNWFDQLKYSAENIFLVKEVVALNKWLNDAFSAFKDRVNDLLSLDIVIGFIVNWLKAQQDVLLNENRVNATIASAEQSRVAATAAARLRSPDRLSYEDCLRAALRSGLGSLDDTKRSIEEFILRAARERYRGKDVTASNSLAANMIMHGCSPNGKGATLEPFASWFAKPQVDLVDDPLKACAPKGENPANDVFRDVPSDMVSFVKLTEPSSGQETNVPKPTESANEDSYVTFARIIQLITALGYRPPFPVAGNQVTAAGVAQAAQWRRCAALEAAYAQPVAAFIARRTRPRCINGVDPDHHFDYACALSDAICNFIVTPRPAGAGFDLKGSSSPMFKGCLRSNKAISIFEIEYASHLICLQNQGAISLSAAGASPGTIAKASDICAGGWSAWQTQLSAERTALILGLQGALELRNCWPQTTPEPPVKDYRLKSFSDAGDITSSHGKTKARAKKAVVAEDKLSPMPIKLKKNLPSGVPVPADEIDLPVVVAQ